MSKIRIDVLMVERGLTESRATAQRLVMAGQVRAADQVILKPSQMVEEGVQVTVEHGPKYVSRGGTKLEAALEQFQPAVTGRVCADVGASTGGFTDCLLQHGARRVYAIDVGKGVLAWKLRQNPAVVVMENTNARYLASLPEAVTLVTIDASFISLKILLPVVQIWFKAGDGEVIALIKPQFEAGRQEVRRGKGVIRDGQVHESVLVDLLGFAEKAGYRVKGLIRSPLLGPKGNTEFLCWLSLLPGETTQSEGLIKTALEAGKP